ncbi:MAG: hypothetical protein INR66_00510 [Gordonia polyisoprenivorans]|nr:hypothetical protein [Gordonia polyisoprenivorans]
MSSSRGSWLTRWPTTRSGHLDGAANHHEKPDVRAAVRVLQDFVRHHSEAASAAVAAHDMTAANGHQLLADVARDAIPAGWSPQPPPWAAPTTIVEAIADGIAAAAQFVGGTGNESEALTSLRNSVCRAAEPSEA